MLDFLNDIVRMRDGRLLIADVKIVKGGIPLAYGKLISFERCDLRPGIGLLLINRHADAGTIHLTQQHRRPRIAVVGGPLEVGLCLTEVGRYQIAVGV